MLSPEPQEPRKTPRPASPTPVPPTILESPLETRLDADAGHGTDKLPSGIVAQALAAEKWTKEQIVQVPDRTLLVPPPSPDAPGLRELPTLQDVSVADANPTPRLTPLGMDSDRTPRVPPPKPPAQPDAISPARQREQITRRLSGSKKLERLGHLKVLNEIARGGMGVVYRAEDEKLGRVVALKILLGEALAAPTALERFQREARAAASLRHPNIVSVYEVGQHEGMSYFTMDYIEGRSLAKVIVEDRPPIPKCLRLAAKIARALHFAHEHKVIHRDVKPSNVLIDAQGEPFLTDFGLAMLDDEGEARLTKSGAILGTPAYMPPEQAEGRRKDVTARSDVYSAGATIYELLTRRPPFLGATNIETVRQVLDNDPIAPRKLDPRIPPDVETICLRALEKDPGKRYPSALELALDLERFLAGEPIQARPSGRVERALKTIRRHPVIALMGLAMLGLVVTGVGAGLRTAAAEKRRLAAQEIAARARSVSALEHSRDMLLEAPVILDSKDDRKRQWLGEFIRADHGSRDTSLPAAEREKRAAKIPLHLNNLPVFGGELAQITSASFVLYVQDRGIWDGASGLAVLGGFVDKDALPPAGRSALERDVLARIPLGPVLAKRSQLRPTKACLGGALYEVVACPWAQLDTDPDAEVCLVVGFALDARWASELDGIVLGHGAGGISLHFVTKDAHLAGTSAGAEAGAVALAAFNAPGAEQAARDPRPESVRDLTKDGVLWNSLARLYPDGTAPWAGEVYLRRVPPGEILEARAAAVILPGGVLVVLASLTGAILVARAHARTARAQLSEAERLAGLPTTATGQS